MKQCKNCEKSLSEAALYCETCGARYVDHRLTLRYLAEEGSRSFFNIDANKPLRTFVDLFKRPEQVIDGYIHGVRKRYIHVIGYLTIAITVSGFFMFILQKWAPDLFNSIYAEMYETDVQAEAFKSWMTFTLEYQTLIIFLTIPILAGISKLVFLQNKKYNYTEHLVLNTYAYSHISLVTTLLFIVTFWEPSIFKWIAVSTLPIQILYFSHVLKRLFALTWTQLLLKVLLFLVVLLVVYIFLVIAAMIYMFLFTDFFQDMIELEKAKRAVSYVVSSAMNWTS
ncbi:DUF3667 domain-containing protein [Altibacter sp. HG106]|uniref:DUF3667 domain-containing protein n=1 Tax=Altibacter sp. HG106 TaxID=3023937 RepID=UPI0023500300|nr:DUF3667 domain-containing protein [Altibacter sp. HG106]MDC7995825.1 DUF3667 domain-containing protein [Altibacter sp. HG106]